MEREATAWMLRQDGKAFPCQFHYYCSPSEIDETIFTAEWLYGATQRDETRCKIIDLIAAYGISLHPKRNLVRNLLIAIKNQPSFFLSHDFVIRHAGEFFYVDPQRIPDLSDAIMHAVNDEFLRTRLGGLYDTVPGNRGLYFRVSGPDFDWLPVIHAFAKNHDDIADTVTVIWDPESTGRSAYWPDRNGRVLDHVPLSEFFI